MKNQLITLLTMGRVLDRAKDRKGAYSLRYVNKFPKFGPVARAAAAGLPAVEQPAPCPQPSLFEAPKVPVAAVAASPPPDNRAEQAVQLPPTERTERTEGTDRTDRTDRSEAPDRSFTPPARKVCSLGFAKFSAFMAGAVAFVPKTAACVCRGLRSPSADSRPRAQGELALDKVTVLRNDLSDADLVVVAVQPKPEDSRAAEAPAREPTGNPWKRVTARWIKLKSQPEGGGLASVASEAPAGRAADLEQTRP